MLVFYEALKQLINHKWEAIIHWSSKNDFFFETYGNDDDVNRYMYVLFILLNPFWII